MTHQHHQHESRNLGVAFLLNLGFTLLEFAGGLLTNSVAVLSDALHDLGDSVSLGLAWGLSRIAQKGEDAHFSYGYRRFSLLGALINALILVIGSLFILTETIPRLVEPESFHAPGMILLAVLGIGVNSLAALRLRGSRSSNAQVIGWHLLEDILGWVAVLVVGVFSLFVDLPILDPLLALMVTAFILVNVLGKLKATLALFLQAVPGGIDYQAIREGLAAIEGVEDVHHMHLWSLDGDQNVFTVHLVVPATLDRAALLEIKNASRALIASLNVAHSTIEIEYGLGDSGLQAEQLHWEQHQN